MLPRTPLLVGACLIGLAGPLAPQSPTATTSELRETVDRYATDRAVLLRRYDVPYSPARQERMRTFYEEWRSRLAAVDFAALGTEGRVDYVLLDHELAYQLALLARDGRAFSEMRPWLPFALTIMDLAEARRRMEPPDGPQVAETLTAVAHQVDSVRKAVVASGKQEGRDRIVGRRAANLLDDLQRSLRSWNRFYANYDPLFTWWTSEPFRQADASLSAYLEYLRTSVVGVRPGEADPIIGDPIGVEGLRADLAHEMIAYTVDELIAIAERAFAWCEAEYRKAAREMGLGDDWRAALERVKQTYVPPGEQTRLVRDLAAEATAFVEARDLLTVPPLAKEIWRMEMISPERQRVSPFFLGGEVFQVSYPTDAMTHEDKLMSMRGNNPHFSRATAHHEMIPGHHLQGFMTSRYQTHRRVFSTPFWGEGWALYWEMLLWDLDFPRGPEDRIGMLFWRSHRAARIIFSLRFHSGTMTPQEAVDFLVDRVGHERANAEGEVRRSLAGDYSPLYQAAYMLGGLQFRALHQELVKPGGMTNREFHDAVLQGGRMPVEMVRARLTGAALSRDYDAGWRFYGDPR
ncbi:MAG: DUF885 domain-containing protein [Gemmatimonadota bacterium]|nr:DUF885 domain-containing protein [Gemmatimonadota bacterium]